MKKPALVLILLALVCAGPAGAHTWRDSMNYSERLLEQRINMMRMFAGRSPVNRALNAEAAASVHSRTMISQGYIGAHLLGVPFHIWTRQFVGGGTAGEIRAYRCHGRPFTAYQVASRIQAKLSSYQIATAPFFRRIGIEAWKFHNHNGYWRGRGTCRLYVLFFA